MREFLLQLVATVGPAGTSSLRWYLAGAIFLVGLGGIFLNRRAVGKVIALNVLNSALVLFFILYGSHAGDTAPILRGNGGEPVDPLVQALMLTAIVVGVCVTALLLVLIQRIYDATGSTDVEEIEGMLNNDEH
jgi:multicomponent Na+:H+ antiporter subunit C